jgi:hypothetical protein
MVGDALLRYLAVAHYGRGRGDYEESEHPEFWRAAVATLTERRAVEIRTIWERGKTAGAEPLTGPLQALLTSAAAELLVQFYPDARDLFANGAAGRAP